MSFLLIVDVLPRTQPLLGFDVIYNSNGKNIGTIERDVDGAYYYWPTQEGGAWSSYVMYSIGQHLDRLNYDFDKVLRDDPRIGRGE